MVAYLQPQQQSTNTNNAAANNTNDQCMAAVKQQEGMCYISTRL
jgi:hypothetical protein